MTTVGKILVILITIFAVIFMAVTVVVFNTATNWKDALTKQQEKTQNLQKSLTNAKNETDVANNALKAAKAAFDNDVKKLNDDIANLKATNDQAIKDITDARKKLEVAQMNAKSAADDAEARRAETDKTRAQFLEREQEANKYKLQNVQLGDEIRQLQRELEVAVTNNKTLRETVSAYSSSLREHGLSDDVRQIKGVGAPPEVEGKVLRLDDKNSTVEISIGSDDGLVPGHILEVFRLKPRAEYIGKIKIISADADQAVGVVQGRTYLGRRVQEGDNVATSFRAGG